MRNQTTIITLSTTLVLTLLILGLASWSYLSDPNIQNTEPGDGTREGWIQPERDAAEQRPRSSNFRSLGLSSIDVAQQQSQFQIQIPDPRSLPAGYSIRGVLYQTGKPEVFNGEQFTVQTATILLWDKQVRQETIDLDFLYDGGIYVEQMYALGTNSTDLYKEAFPEAFVTYMWGFPIAIMDGHVEVFQSEQNVVYRVHGLGYSGETLLKIMESIVN